MRSTWCGLLLDFFVARYDSSPGQDADIQIEEIEVVEIENEREFRDAYPIGAPEDIIEKFDTEVREAMREDVLDGTATE